MENCQNHCRNVVLSYIYNSFFRSQGKYFCKIFTSRTKRQKKILNTLIRIQLGPNIQINSEQNRSEKRFINFTNLKYLMISMLLGMGGMFNLPFEK